jgi:hypothetical protein
MVNNIRAIGKHQGEYIAVVGDTYRIIISGKQSGGEYAINDMLVPSGGGPPPHAKNF